MRLRRWKIITNFVHDPISVNDDQGNVITKIDSIARKPSSMKELHKLVDAHNESINEYINYTAKVRKIRQQREESNVPVIGVDVATGPDKTVSYHTDDYPKETKFDHPCQVAFDDIERKKEELIINVKTSVKIDKDNPPYIVNENKPEFYDAIDDTDNANTRRLRNGTLNVEVAGVPGGVDLPTTL